MASSLVSSVFSKSRLRTVVILFALATLGVAGWKLIGAEKAAQPATKNDRPTETPALPVTGVTLESQLFKETITATGTLRADEAVEIQTEVNGKISAVRFQEGQLVKAGDVLVKIDDSTLQASLRRSEARRALAVFRERRLARLVAEGGVSRQEYDEASGELDVLLAEGDIIRADIAKTEIRAPFDGRIGLRFVSVGAYVNPTTRIATLQRLDQLKVDFSVPERYATRVRTGDPLQFTAAGSNTTYTAEVIAQEPRIDVATRTILIRALCRDPDPNLLPGLFARVSFTVSQAENALLVPAIAIIAGLDERFVFVARDGKALRVPVRVGARTATHVQIIEGLQPGETVLTSGVQQLRNGLPVRVTGTGA